MTEQKLMKSDLHEETTFDLVILGGGLAGLTLALQAKQKVPKLKVLVVEKDAHPAPEAAFKVGESSVEVSAHYFTNVLGLKKHILEEQLPKLGLRFFFPHGDNSAIENRLELGGRRFPPAPSYQLDRGRFENFLAARCEDYDIHFQDNTRVKDLALGAWSKNHRVTLSGAVGEQEVSTRWVVDASGRNSFLKNKLNLGRSSDHKASSAWFRVQEKICIDDWCQSSEWRDGHTEETARWYSTNHLMGPGYWVWLIPLSSGSTSVGIVAADSHHDLRSFNSLEKAEAWLRKHEPQCAEKVFEHREKIQDFLARKHYATEASQVFSSKRWAIVGDAGFFLDPFYSPGSDFIAFGNTFITELIAKDIRGKSILYDSFYFDRLYKTFYKGTLSCYSDLYPIFGSAKVMPVKILWDYMIYWTITAFVYFHDRLCDTWMYPRHMLKLKRLNDLNHHMQPFFRRWHDHIGESREVTGRINMSTIPLIFDTNQALLENLSDREYGKRFAKNVETVEALFWEIIDAAPLQEEAPFRRKKKFPVGGTNYFEQVFEAAREEKGAMMPENAVANL